MTSMMVAGGRKAATDISAAAGAKMATDASAAAGTGAEAGANMAADASAAAGTGAEAGTATADVRRRSSRRERTRSATDRKIMEATIATLSAQGVGAVTIEEIARRSGVAKTTIYRRYRNADDLLRRIQFEAAIVPDFGDLAPTREGLICMLERIMVNFDGTIGLKAVGAVLSGGDDYLQRLAAQVIGPAQQRFEDFIRRGQRSGVFAASADTAFLFATVLGSMMAAKALRGDSGISDDTSADAIAVWPARMAAFLWPALARTPASA